MTQETKHKIKMKLLADARERAVASLRSMGACPGPAGERLPACCVHPGLARR